VLIHNYFFKASEQRATSILLRVLPNDFRGIASGGKADYSSLSTANAASAAAISEALAMSTL
jgi:redox-regulated HSP33 family molecular chaperone